MDIDRSKISPMMRQYLEMKDKYEDCVLFFRLGDFYEMFFDDAVSVSKALELTLTGRDCGLEERAPMCGVPYHAADMYIKRLIDLGFKVAVCEQLTDPAESKGIVIRDVIRVVTPRVLLPTAVCLTTDATTIFAVSTTTRRTSPVPLLLRIFPQVKPHSALSRARTWKQAS
ncbi:MAG TPA: hypothetical protein PKI82_10095 [Ruminococcus flavefaciens]|nr:hypothetical protein [Ruminococcus flavefaciens]